jgi:hypothetical protein
MSRSGPAAYARDRLLGGEYLHLDEDSMPWILRNIDCFVKQCQKNKSVSILNIYPYECYGQKEGSSEKLGNAVANIQGLKMLQISTPHYYQYADDSDDDDEEVPAPDWELLTHILKHVRQRIILKVTHVAAWRLEDSRAFAKAIKGHPAIWRFEGDGRFPYVASSVLYTTLAALPILESINFCSRGRCTHPEDESKLTFPKSLTKLLMKPTLWSICFSQVFFTRALCHAVANALMKSSTVTHLEFGDCKFSTYGSDRILGTGLGRNTSVDSISIVGRMDIGIINALAMALPSNTRLRDLSFVRSCFIDVHLSLIFSALGKNKALKVLKIDVNGPMQEGLCTAMNDGFAMNKTLQTLEFHHVPLFDDTVDSWRRTLSFLRTNKSLKSLVFDVQYGVMTPPSVAQNTCLSNFRLDICAMLEENESLKKLALVCRYKVYAEEYAALITVLQRNRTITTLSLDGFSKLRLTEAEDKHLANLLHKNCGLEWLPGLDLSVGAGDVSAILRLNEAGRKYLVQDGSSITKGVQVLSSVTDDINCMFMHLSENPRLCDRTAVEAPATANASSSGGEHKRERVTRSKTKESRRKVA